MSLKPSEERLSFLLFKINFLAVEYNINFLFKKLLTLVEKLNLYIFGFRELCSPVQKLFGIAFITPVSIFTKSLPTKKLRIIRLGLYINTSSSIKITSGTNPKPCIPKFKISYFELEF